MYYTGQYQILALSEQHNSHIHRLLHSTRRTLHRYRLHRLELNAIEDPEMRHRRLVELNVIEQCLNLFKTGAVQRKRVDTYKAGGEYVTPRIHACVFDPKTGDMNRLVVSNKKCARRQNQGYCLSF
jgi:carbonic anhydrase